MARTKVEGLDTKVMPWRTAEGVLAGMQTKPLSRDPDTGDESLLVRLKAGQSLGRVAGRAWDIFVLSGELVTASGAASVGHYVYVPGNDGNGEIVARAASELFVGLTEKQSRTGDVLVVDPDLKDWDVRQRELPGSKNGTMTSYVKFLRVDEEHNLTIGLGATLPDSGLDFTETHVAIDELLVLSGDHLMLDSDERPVEMGPGSYYWRTPYLQHLPKYSFAGAINFFRTHNALWGIPIEFGRVDGWNAIRNEYRRSRLRTQWIDK